VIEPLDFCQPAQPSNASPIDDYYEYVGDLMTLGDEQSLADSSVLGRLLLLGLVSGVEQYFRSILAGSLRICSVSRTFAGDQVIHFGAIDHYGYEGVEAALFDATSLANAAEIRKRTEKLLGIPIDGNSSVQAALDEFDKVCVMRHAAVHSRGTLGRGNVRDLGLSGVDDETKVLDLSFKTAQQAGAACHSVVRAYNRFLFRRLLERWAVEGHLTWDWPQDRALITAFAGLFRSKADGVGPSRTYDMYRSFRSTFS